MQRPAKSLVDDRPSSQRAGALSAGVALLVFAALPVCVLAVVTPSTFGAATAPAADVSALVAGAALLLAWAVALRLAVTALAAPLAHLPGAVGAFASRVADAASPAVLRSLVRIAMGASVVVVPCGLSGVALADAGPEPMPVTVGATPAMQPPSASVMTGVRVLPPGWLSPLATSRPGTATPMWPGPGRGGTPPIGWPSALTPV